METYDRLAPLYAQVKRRLAERISAGVLNEGDFLPPEHDLCTEMGVSRITLRRAVKELSDEGILIRQQGRGTVVARGKIHQTLVSLSGFSEAFEKDGHRVEHDVFSIDHDVADSGAGIALSPTRPSALTRFRRLISVDGRPFTLEELILDQDLHAKLFPSISSGESFFQALRATRGPAPATAERLINVGFATSDERNKLKIGRSQPVYRIEKTVFDAGNQPIAFSRLVTPTHLITYSVRC